MWCRRRYLKPASVRTRNVSGRPGPVVTCSVRRRSSSSRASFVVWNFLMDQPRASVRSFRLRQGLSFTLSSSLSCDRESRSGFPRREAQAKNSDWRGSGSLVTTRDRSLDSRLVMVLKRIDRTRKVLSLREGRAAGLPLEERRVSSGSGKKPERRRKRPDETSWVGRRQCENVDPGASCPRRIPSAGRWGPSREKKKGRGELAIGDSPDAPTDPSDRERAVRLVASASRNG